MSNPLLNNYNNIISRDNNVLSRIIKINNDDISKINNDDISKINNDISKINNDDISSEEDSIYKLDDDISSEEMNSIFKLDDMDSNVKNDDDGYVSEIDDIIILNIVDKSIKNRQFIVGLDQNIMREEQKSSTFTSTLSSVVNGLLFTKLGREVLYAGTMYMAGSAIIATVGIVPVVATGAAIYLL